jgi:hypothetical protein
VGKSVEKRVDPRGLEPLTSAMRGQQSIHRCLPSSPPKPYKQAEFALYA